MYICTYIRMYIHTYIQSMCMYIQLIAAVCIKMYLKDVATMYIRIMHICRYVRTYIYFQIHTHIHTYVCTYVNLNTVCICT